MKISLFISGLGNGGAERVFIKLFEYLTQLNYDVELVCATKKGVLVDNVDLKVNYLFGLQSIYI